MSLSKIRYSADRMQMLRSTLAKTPLSDPSYARLRREMDMHYESLSGRRAEGTYACMTCLANSDGHGVTTYARPNRCAICGTTLTAF